MEISRQEIKAMRDYIQQVADIAEREKELEHLWRAVGYAEQFCRIHLREVKEEEKLVAA